MQHEPANYEHIRLVLNALDCEPCEVEHVEFDDEATQITVRCDDETVHHIRMATIRESAHDR